MELACVPGVAVKVTDPGPQRTAPGAVGKPGIGFTVAVTATLVVPSQLPAGL